MYYKKQATLLALNQFLQIHFLKICNIFTYNDRTVHKLLPKHKISVNVFSASAGAVGTDQAQALTLIASGAAAAFCFFSAAGKEKRIIMS